MQGNYYADFANGAYLKKRHPLIKMRTVIIMNTLKIVGKAAIYFGAVSAIFTIILAISTYRLIEMVNSTAMPPIDYLILSILSNVFPYLFLTVVSFVTAYVLRDSGEEIVEIEEELPPTPVQPAELND